MNNANQVRRDYAIPDADMLADAKMKQAYFARDIADFEAFDNDVFNQAFSTSWLQAMATVEQTMDDEAVLEQQTQLTAAIESGLTDCRNFFQKQLKYFIEKAFPAQPVIWNEFGYNDYDKARLSARDMVRFMRKLHIIMLKYQTQLLAANFPPESVGSADTLRIALDTILTTQEFFIGSRPGITQDRVKKLNTVYSHTAQVCRVGKLLYDNTPDKYACYLIRQPDQTATPPAA